MDEESGLIYMKARFYDPVLGQFLNQDSFEGTIDTPPSLHKYLYAFGNPVFYIDPDGRTAIGNDIERSIRALANIVIEEGVERQKRINRIASGRLTRSTFGNGQSAARSAGLTAGGLDVAADVVALADFAVNEIGVISSKLGLVSNETASSLRQENIQGVGQFTNNLATSVQNIPKLPGRLSNLAARAAQDDPRANAEIGRLTGNVVVGAGGVATIPNAARKLATGVNKLAKPLTVMESSRTPGPSLVPDSDSVGAMRVKNSVVPDGIDSSAARRTYLNEKFGRTGDLNTDISVRGYLDEVERLDVSSGYGESIFYSGPGNKARAEAFSNGGGTTLESTPGGARLDNQVLFKRLDPEQAIIPWERL